MSSTYHSPHPDVWRTQDAVTNLKAVPWAIIAGLIDQASARARPARTPQRVDGYPTRTLADGGGTAELTSVEAAADANLYGRTTPDQDSLHDLVTEARALLVECSGTARQLTAKIELIRTLLGQATLEQRACDLCGATDRPLRFGDVAGRLPVSRLLCTDTGPGGAPCYKVVVRNDGWPSDEQQAAFRRTGRWTYRVRA